MTKKAKAKVNKIRYTGVKPKTLAACVIATASLVVMMGVLSPMSKQSVDAQMMMGHNGGNMTSDLQELQQNVMANGTINLEQTILEAISSKVNTSLTQAITTAQHTVGNDSYAVAAFGGEYGGYFAYQVIVSTARMEFYTVLVDPGNGHILATQKVSAAELEKLHEEHSAQVVGSNNGEGSGGIGFPFLIPH
jgi:uncharacterized iron-regulated membrane protein